MKGAAPLRRCPKCGGRWPDDEAHSLRSLRFMDSLPRGITPTNLDALAIHNGADGDWFYVFEAKALHEPWPMQAGQLRALRALAALPRFRVFVLRGTEHRMDVYQVTRAGLLGPYPYSGAAVHDWLTTWLETKAA